MEKKSFATSCPVCNNNYDGVIHTRQVCERCLFIYGTLDNNDNSISFFRSKTSPKLLTERNGIIYNDFYECYVNGIPCMAKLLFDELIIISTIPVPSPVKKTKKELESKYDY